MIKRYISKLLINLLSSKVSPKKKFLFLSLTSLYWILPDLLPLIPLDDILFTLLASWAFLNSTNKDIGNSSKKDKKIIDIEGKVIEDE